VTDALLVMEDGTHHRGRGFGATGTAFGEIVFNTGMTGYQEVLTDPSYRRQIVTMTAPQVGNYGMNAADAESDRIQVAGYVVREAARRPSSWRAEQGLREALADADVVGIEDVDTRAVTRHVRTAGAMRAAVSTEVLDVDALLEQVRESPGMVGADLASEVTTTQPYDVSATGGDARFRVVAIDFGIKRNILRMLAARGCDVRVLPADATPDDVLEHDPDGVFLSPGPGDPAAVTQGIATTEALLGVRPVFGICLGSQLLGRALGAETGKLRFGHRGVNQPVLRRADGVVEITSHNHGFAVEASSLGREVGTLTFETAGHGTVEVSHVNLNDDVVEGIECHDLPAFTVQYHPEAAPGPHDASYLFDRFTALMARTTGVPSG
jgi:carbamoyl-phosphate synthase small subunit